MKTIALLLLAFTGYSQSATTHFYHSSVNTSGAELTVAIRGTDSTFLGGGFSGAWDVHKGSPNREEWCSLYAVASFGYLGPVMVKYRAGLATDMQKDVVLYCPLLGASAMYELTKDVGLELGVDTFNKVTLGFTILF